MASTTAGMTNGRWPSFLAVGVSAFLKPSAIQASILPVRSYLGALENRYIDADTIGIMRVLLSRYAHLIPPKMEGSAADKDGIVPVALPRLF